MASRRGKGEGSITQRRDGRWEARIALEPVGGKRQRRAFYGVTRTEVAKKLREAQKKQDEGVPLPPENLTLASHLQAWLEGKKSNLRPKTWRRYDTLSRLYLIPELGRFKLTKLEPAHLRTAYISIGAKVSGTTTAHAHGVLHVALRDAEREGLVSRNVASLVTAPRRSTEEMRFLGPDDAKALLAAAVGDPLEALFALAMTSGLRLGELQALRWADVDETRQRVRVIRTLTGVVDGKPTFGEPKTQKSRRTVWLSVPACEALERHRERQAAQRKEAGPAWSEYGLVFTNAFGRPVDGSHVLSRSLHPLLEKAKLPRMRFHDLRHTAATLLLSEGVPVKVVSEMLGHADIATTLRIYAHVIEGAQEQAVSVMDRLFHA